MVTSSNYIQNQKFSRLEVYNMYLKMLLTSFLFYFVIQPISAFDIDPVGNQVEEGISKYKSQKYKESLDNFKAAEQKLEKEDEKLAYNKGTSYYKLKNYDLALKQFEKSSLSDNKELKVKSLFNKGNSFYQMGDKRNAIKSFLQAIKIDPEFEPARKNLELMQKIEQQNQKNAKQQEEEGENSQSLNNQDNSDSQEDSDQNKQKGMQGKPSENEDDKQQSESENQPQKQKELTKEEAERILESARQRDVKRKLHKGKNSRNEVFW
ncbi:MAG: tetratricopeptide repeat protein [Leptospiraceae bacterium]|nr:tetratricopeptide repeat protein [Leptospiraceae bacterium]MCP5494837.1 tetratricopeptide repeat protein [Leptospiraceae bacterium]